jgi:hypothetical protein
MRKTNDFMDLKALHTACEMSQKEKHARTRKSICHTQAIAYAREAPIYMRGSTADGNSLIVKARPEDKLKTNRRCVINKPQSSETSHCKQFKFAPS